MWRRRREKARAGAARTDATAPGGTGTGTPGTGPGGWGTGPGSRGAADSQPGRIPGRLTGRGRRAWGRPRRGSARVALTPPAEFSRRTTLDQRADMVPAPAEWSANGRLGRTMASVY